jgi:hypothetical protein
LGENFEMTNKPKVTFAPGCFNAFEGTQEELDALIQKITELVTTGELFENATPFEVDEEEDELEDEFDETFVSAIKPRTLH